jgi:hypothetical protein
MDLRFVILANSAEVGPDGRFFVLGGGIDGIGLASIPSVFPALAVLCRIHFSRQECRRQYQVRLKMTYPDGTDSPVAAGFGVTPDFIGPEFEDFGSNVDVAFSFFGLPIPQTGVYRFLVFADEKKIGDHPFFVQATEAQKEGTG